MKLEDNPIPYHHDFHLHHVKARSDKVIFGFYRFRYLKKNQQMQHLILMHWSIFLSLQKMVQEFDSMAALLVKYPKLIFWVVICQTRHFPGT